MTLIDTIFSQIKSNQTIGKYNQLCATNLLEIMNFEKSFKWSEYYWHISELTKTSDENILDIMYNIELIGIAARLMDDFLDKDTPLANAIHPEHLSLLSTELLLESLASIGHCTYFDYSLLKEALHAEFIDYSTVLNSQSSIAFYFENIIPKSTAIFRLVTKLASHNNLNLDQFAIHYGTLLQIENDIAGILNNHSVDILQMKNTLPLIASVNTLNPDSNNVLLSMLNNSNTYSLESLQNKLIQTGAIAFCKEQIAYEKKKSLIILNEITATREVAAFKKYLRLEKSS